MNTQTLSHTPLEDWRLMVILPGMLLVAAVFFEYSGFDVWWVSHFYDSQKHIWTFKHHWLFDTVIHSGGQLIDKFVAILWLLLIVAI